MRNLILLYGCPGSGKSTLIDRLGVADMTLGYDQFRALMSTTVRTADGDWGWFLGRDAGDRAVEACHTAAMSRMSYGETLFIDATNLPVSDQAAWAKRAEKFGYATHILNVQGDLTYAEAVARNEARGLKRIDADVLRKMWEIGASGEFSDRVTEVTTDQLPSLAQLPYISPGRTIVVGDVHSCAGALASAIDSHDAPGTRWVFVGDLFDRGPDPVGVYRTVTERLAGRTTIVTGNHEQNLWRVINRTHPMAFRDTIDTVDMLTAAGISREDILALADSTVPAAVIGADNHPGFVVTHGGVDDYYAGCIRALARGEDISADMALGIADVACVAGVGDRGTAWLGRFDYDVAAAPVAGYQFHGHRNGPRRGPAVDIHRDLDSGPVWCLDRGAGGGGELGIAIVDAAGNVDTHVFADGVCPAPAARPRRATATLAERMTASPYVKVRPVDGHPGIVACNFTREAFTTSAWDTITVAARGLFLDTRTSEVVARGYDKFFHLDEEPGRTIEQWRRLSAWPVTARRKVNGFLALVADVDGELVCWTKAGPTAYSEAARPMVVAACGGPEGAEKLRDMLARTNTTALFEVIRDDDPHPVDEGSPRVVLLDVVNNREQFSTHDSLRRGIAARFGIEVAPVVGTAAGPDEFDELIDAARSRDDEGVVLIDAAGYRGKVKGARYAARKALRGTLLREWTRRRKGESPGDVHALIPRGEADRLAASGVWEHLTDYTIRGVNGAATFDLATACSDAGL